MLAAEIFLSLKGNWNLRRNAFRHGHMEGKAVFSPLSKDESILYYREEGIHTTAKKGAFPFHREYFYGLKDQKIHVYFSRNQKQGRLFHTLDFIDNNTAKTLHHCGKDVYRGLYSFINKDTFTLEYKVDGPRKDQRILTTFQRC